MIATLFYLSNQIRANTWALRVEARRAEMNSGAASLQPIITSPDVAQLFVAGLRLPRGVFPAAVERLNWLRPEFVMSVGDLIEGYTEDRLAREPRALVQHVSALPRTRRRTIAIARMADPHRLGQSVRGRV